MPNSPLFEHLIKRFTKYVALTILIWTSVISFSLWFNIRSEKQYTDEVVKSAGLANFNKDMSFRLWGTSHGGVYVPPTKKTPPSPWMAHLPDRDITTIKGKKFTLMNPAYMLRQMMEDYSSMYGIRGRIVGTSYLNPANKADLWETKAIESFINGIKIKTEVVGHGKNKVFRYLKPIIMRQACQKCHGHLNFKNGSVRGAIGVIIPYAPFLKKEKIRIASLLTSYLFVWFVGFIGIVFTTRKFGKGLIQKQKTHEELKISAKLFENSHDANIITDSNINIIRTNKAFTKITGYTAKEVVNKKPDIIKSGYHPQKFYDDMWRTIYREGSWKGEVWNKKKDGTTFITAASMVSVKDDKGKIVYFIGTFHDISQKKKTENKLRYLALYDPLTGLPNRSFFQDSLKDILVASSRSNSQVALLFLDLDRFKKVNDSLGHQVGDKLLIEVGKRLRKCVRTSDTVSRLGGDEFTVILKDITDLKAVALVAQKILAVVSKGYFIEQKEFSITISIGISIFPSDGMDSTSLVKNADSAMFKAKEEGKNRYSFYTQELSIIANSRLEIENNLKKAISNKEFLVYYQPKISTATGKIVGMEALVRWNHPTKGLVLPDSFMSVAQDMGIIGEIDRFVLEVACIDTKQWISQGFNLLLSVNISGSELNESNYVEKVLAIVKETAINTRYLELEITESFFVKFQKKQTQILNDLRKNGVRLSIDDFGTGYASFSYLKNIPVDTLKVDRSFIADINSNKNDKILVANIITMAHDLGLKVVAEGVEEQSQYDFLKKKHCDEIQGYLFSKAVDKYEFSQLLKKLS